MDHIFPPETEFRVWHIPQVPGEPFLYPVDGLNTGKMILDILAKYDLFQLEHRIKPDFANVNGISFRHPVHTNNEWWNIDPDDEDEVADIASMLNGTQG